MRLATMDSDGIGKWAKEHTAPCPNCKVLIERSQGCDTMWCACGTQFNWETARQTWKGVRRNA